MSTKLFKKLHIGALILAAALCLETAGPASSYAAYEKDVYNTQRAEYLQYTSAFPLVSENNGYNEGLMLDKAYEMVDTYVEYGNYVNFLLGTGYVPGKGADVLAYAADGSDMVRAGMFRNTKDVMEMFSFLVDVNRFSVYSPGEYSPKAGDAVFWTDDTGVIVNSGLITEYFGDGFSAIVTGFDGKTSEVLIDRQILNALPDTAYNEPEEVPEETADGETAEEGAEQKESMETEEAVPAPQASETETEEKQAEDGSEEVEMIHAETASYLNGVPGLEDVFNYLFVKLDYPNNDELVFLYLTKVCGFNNASAAGIMTNIYCESLFRPEIEKNNTNDYGLCQWSYGRKQSLELWCKEQGLDYRKLYSQLDFMKHELETSFTAMYADLKYKDVSEDTAAYAASRWCEVFERPSGWKEIKDERSITCRRYFWPAYGGYPYIP